MNKAPERAVKEKDVNLQQIQAEINLLTGLYFSHAFFKKAEEYLEQVVPEDYCMVAIDLEHFRLFNKLYGRGQGDELLVAVADQLKDFVEGQGGVAGYLSGDNFGVLMVYDKALIKKLRKGLTQEIREFSNTAGFLPAFGIYHITAEKVHAATMYDRATLALSQVIGNYTIRECEYSTDMDDKVEEEIRILSEVQEGLEKEEFTFFIQPQCDISNGKIVGGESLVRWMHGEKGMIPPGKFIPVLEKNGFIANLDRYVWRKVCEWLRNWIDKGYHPVPISINVSRIDIFSMDVPAYLNELINKYRLPAKLLKVEITESAYAESNDKIIRTVKQLRDADFLVMMDDFGSGYSSLNMLKSVSVDVLKIDMRFLEINESEEEKGIGILESVINMARQMRIPIVVEGVETQVQENFLLKMGCRYSQGYYYYKPLPIAEFEKLISDERRLDLDGIWCRQIESMHVREFLDDNLFNDTTFNNILGAAAFYDLYENNLEITRVNEQYFKLAGISAKEGLDYNKKFGNHVRDDDGQLLFSIFNQAYENPATGSSGYIHFIRTDGETLWVYIRVLFLRENDGHKMFYGSLMDMSSFQAKRIEESILDKEVDDLTSNQLKHIEKYYGKLPCGYAVGKLLLNEEGVPSGYDIIYANSELGRMAGGDMERLEYLMEKLFSDRKEELLEKAYHAAYLGEKIDFSVYSKLSSKYLQLTLFPFQRGYACCMIQDITHLHIYEETLNNVLLSFREVYYIHLQDNYCRMIYPDDDRMLDRGNYEEVVNRHFGTGKILPYDEKSVRQFLSLSNIKHSLRKEESIEYKYRRKAQDLAEEWCLTTIYVNERENGVPKTAIMTIRSIEALMREKQERKRQNMAEMLASVSDGFFIYRATDDEKVLFVNPTVFKIFGCEDMEEYRQIAGTTFIEMVHPEDRKRVQWEIHEQVKQSDRKMDYIRYRIIRKDGEVRWIDDCGHLENGESTDGKLFYVFITDITDTITQQQIDRILGQNANFNNDDFYKETGN